MSRRVEIQPAPRGLARVETFIEGRLTGVSESMSVIAARQRAGAIGGDLVDHTLTPIRPLPMGRQPVAPPRPFGGVR